MAWGCRGTPALEAGQLGQAGGYKRCFALLFLKSLVLSPDFLFPSQHSSLHTSNDSMAFHYAAVSIETGGRGGKWETTSQRGNGRAPTPFPPWGQPTVTRPPSSTGHVMSGQRSPTPPALSRGDRGGMLLRDVGSTLTPHSRGWLVPCSPHPRPGALSAGAAPCSLAPTPPWPGLLARATLPQGCVGQTQTPISAEGSWAKTSGQSPPCPSRRHGCATPPTHGSTTEASA